MKLTLVISSLACGGAERVMSIMANYWVTQGWDITLLTFDDGTIPPFYELNSRVIHQPLGIASDSPNKIVALWNNFQRIHKLRAAIAVSQPDAVVSFIDQVNILTLFAVNFPPFLQKKALSESTYTIQKLPAIVAEHTDPRFHAIGLYWQFLRRLYYPLAAQVIFQGEELCSWARRAWWPSRVLAIPNPIFPPARSQFSSENRSDLFPQPHTAIAMGRLHPVKGFDRLIEAFAEIAPRFPDWHLTILGEGELRPQLEAQIAKLGLGHRISLPGRIDEPANVLGQADLFVLSSHYEGFPNAMLEAMACGLPAIALDTSSGPRAIVRHNIDGLLVSPTEKNALSKAMADLMADDDKRQNFAARAPEVLERFSPKRAIAAWEAVIAASLGL